MLQLKSQSRWLLVKNNNKLKSTHKAKQQRVELKWHCFLTSLLKSHCWVPWCFSCHLGFFFLNFFLSAIQTPAASTKIGTTFSLHIALCTAVQFVVGLHSFNTYYTLCLWQVMWLKFGSNAAFVVRTSHFVLSNCYIAGAIYGFSTLQAFSVWKKMWFPLCGKAAQVVFSVSGPHF